MHTRPRTKAKRAFTLIEILIVVVILGILAAIIIPQFAESADAAKTNAANSTLKTVRAQVELYKFKEAACPTLAQLEDGYLVDFQQPEGYTIAITGTYPDCTVTMTPN